MTQVLIKVYIERNDSKFLYWSVVLDTVLNPGEIDYNYLNAKAIKAINLINFPESIISFDFSFFDSSTSLQDYEGYLERPSFFLAKEFSPYKNCCCNVKNYYPTAFEHQKSFLKFIETFVLITDEQFFKLQQEIHNVVEEKLGLNIFKCESLPGCLSIYSSLPVFDIQTEQRKIVISTNTSENYYIEITIQDCNCILFSSVFPFNSSSYTITLPSVQELESWFHFNISIFKHDNQKLEIVYKNESYLMRSVSCGMNIIGGCSSLIKNRFLNKIETIPIQMHSSFSTSDESTPWHDWKQLYLKYFGLNKVTSLESIFFDFTKTGQIEFLDWMKERFSGSEQIIIIDPYFDKNGLESLISCRITDVPIKLATLNPDISKREGEELTSKDLENSFYKYFSQGELYYCSKNELHDRYLIIESFGTKLYYNLSNSWNGAFKNNHSLLISQLNRKCEKQFDDCYADCFTNDKLIKRLTNTIDNSEILEEERIYTREDAKQLLRKAILTNTFTPMQFVNTYRSIYVFHAYGKMGKSFINHFFIDSLKKRNIDYRNDIISIAIKELLTEQKNRFVKKNRFCKSTNENYDDITVVNNIRMHGIHEFDLELDWGYFYMLQALFYEYPDQVISSLCEESKNISKVYVKDGKGQKEEKYDLSRDIICLLLEKRYARIHKRNVNNFIEFAKKTNSLLCKYYIFNSYIDSYKQEITIQCIENLLNVFQFDLDERNEVYKKIYNELISDDQSFECLTKNDIELYASYNFISRKDLLLDFALNSYVFNKELDENGICSFLQMNNFIKDDLFLLILFYSLSSCSDKKLLQFLYKELKPEYYRLIENMTASTLCNFHKYLPFLGKILAEALCNCRRSFNKLEFRFDINYSVIFNTIALKNKDVFFVLNIIFECLKEMKIKKFDISQNVKNIIWYIPILFNSASYDVDDIDIKFAELFASLCTTQQKVDIHNKLCNNRIKSYF